MKVAVVGAGFAGLAACYYLLRSGRFTAVTLIDGNGVGGGASGVAAGLLHPFMGKHARLARYGIEGYSAAGQLLAVAERALGRNVAAETGILRLPSNPDQAESFRTAASRYDKMITFLTPEQISRLAPGVSKSEGIYISLGQTVFCHDYLEGLWLACQQFGATFERRFIVSRGELDSFNKIILALGACKEVLHDVSSLRLTYTKGQLLELAWPQKAAPLTVPLNSQVYCTMLADKQSALVGSTYERNYVSESMDINFAISEIMPRVSVLFPELKNAEVIKCRAGLRASTVDKLPLLKQIDERCWVFTGLGSRGLLYHALYGKQLAEML